jgi:hypothetical protein
MNGWTPQMVWRLPKSVHAELVQMLLEDDKAHAPKSEHGLTLNTGFADR